MTWAGLARSIRACTACDLAATRTQAVPGQLPTAGAAVLLVGEGPGAAEDACGEPFVGRSGQLLDELLAQAGLPRHTVAVANVVKCRPPGNRAPKRPEIATCRHWLVEQIEVIDPRVVVALGGTATQWFLGPGARLTQLRGVPQRWDGRTLVVTYHPSAALRFGPRGAPVAALRADLQTVAAVLAEREGGVTGSANDWAPE